MEEDAHYAGVFIHNFPERMRDMLVLFVRDKRYPENVKLPGGMAEAVSAGPPESPADTMRREAGSETGAQVLEEWQYYKERRITGGRIHWRYFYLAKRVSGLPALTTPPREVSEANPGDQSVENLTCFWVPLADVTRDLLYRGQHLAFGGALACLATDPVTGSEFRRSFQRLLDEFPEPQDWGY